MNKTYWQPTAVKTVLAMGFPDFKKYYERPLFIRVTKRGTIDKRQILAVGCEQLPAAAVIIQEDFIII